LNYEDLVESLRLKDWTLPAPVLVHCASVNRSDIILMMHLGTERWMSGGE
jgi:hypothetical protein